MRDNLVPEVAAAIIVVKMPMIIARIANFRFGDFVLERVIAEIIPRTIPIGASIINRKAKEEITIPKNKSGRRTNANTGPKLKIRATIATFSFLSILDGRILRYINIIL